MSHRSGEPCPNCPHYLTVCDTLVRGESRIQYLGCRKCGYRPPDNKRTMPKDAPSPRLVKATS